MAKLTEEDSYTIVQDYLGTPIQAFDSKGEVVWDCLLDIYGDFLALRGERSFVPFRFQGQYEDEETGLYYNRFRYYSPQSGNYISQAPIRLEGNNPTLYAYVNDTLTEIDPLGLFFGKIIGKAQSTGAFGHSFVSKLYASAYSLNPKVKRVTLNLGYKRLLGGGYFRYGPRPDIGVLFKDGTVKVIEVAPRQTSFPLLKPEILTL